MRCVGASNPKICLECPYPECMANDLGNLPRDMVKDLFQEKYYRRYYRKNRDKILERKRTDAGKAISREASRRYRKKNAEKVREAARKYRELHREELREHRREYYKRTGK